ncbi:MAG: hypothetical protein PHQ40_06305 [Anaerolineaceae bacterium]|nr:hypothetical protein [Anaerolineaceae bacterium]
METKDQIANEKQIYMLVDYRGHFYSSTRYKGASMDTTLLQEYFRAVGFDLIILGYPEINFRDNNYSGCYFIYQSSEDQGGLYKSYIDDILCGLALQGAILIPRYELFKAHHNKVFMEILRDLNENLLIKTIKSSYFGTLEDFVRFPCGGNDSTVMKPAFGAASRGVVLTNSRKERMYSAGKLSGSYNIFEAIKIFLKPLFREHYVKESLHRRKFISQNFISGLDNDFKVLVYGEKYYVLRRKNRKNDFRASGSGLFTYDTELPDGLLQFIRSVFSSFDVPFLSADICYDGINFHLLEFQFIMFGQYTLEKSGHYYSLINNSWVSTSEKPNLEKEFVNSIVQYICK